MTNFVVTSLLTISHSLRIIIRKVFYFHGNFE